MTRKTSDSAIMRKTLDVNRRIVFLSLFVAAFTIRMSVQSKVEDIASTLHQTLPIELTMLSNAAVALSLVLGVIPIKSIPGVTTKTQLQVLLILALAVLLVLSVSSIVIPLYQMTSSL